VQTGRWTITVRGSSGKKRGAEKGDVRRLGNRKKDSEPWEICRRTSTADGNELPKHKKRKRGVVWKGWHDGSKGILLLCQEVENRAESGKNHAESLARKAGGMKGFRKDTVGALGAGGREQGESLLRKERTDKVETISHQSHIEMDILR